jgi:hypothetical protein
VLVWPKRCKLAHAFLWEYSDKGLKLAQLLGQLGVFLTWMPTVNSNSTGSVGSAAALAASSSQSSACVRTGRPSTRRMTLPTGTPAL